MVVLFRCDVYKYCIDINTYGISAANAVVPPGRPQHRLVQWVAFPCGFGPHILLTKETRLLLLGLVQRLRKRFLLIELVQHLIPDPIQLFRQLLHRSMEQANAPQAIDVEDAFLQGVVLPPDDPLEHGPQVSGLVKNYFLLALGKFLTQ